ncbi:MAG: MmcQ/YjbR family DNA-binding protein, partial [Thermoanaerobaculia bacterium]
EQEMRIAADPERFFRPPYVGPSGWVGVQLDRRVSWKMVEEMLIGGWRLVAPKKLLATLPGPGQRA